jgi:hypothetical protein
MLKTSLALCETGTDAENTVHEVVECFSLMDGEGRNEKRQQSFARAVAANVDEFCPARASDLVR